MKIKSSTPILSGSKCTRCGKPRIIIDSYTEKVDTATVTYTIAACSDPECQKIVDKLLGEDERKRGIIKTEQVRRENQRKEAKLRKNHDFII